MTPIKARELARDAALDLGCIRHAIGSLADQVEALTKERDAHRTQVEAQNTEISRLKLERDFLTLANKDLSEAMVRYQQLQEAAKLALDALIAESRTTENAVTLARILKAIAALRQAGVQ